MNMSRIHRHAAMCLLGHGLPWAAIASAGVLLASCGKPQAPKPVAAPVPPAAAADSTSPDGPDIFDIKAHPGAMVLHARNPATLTDSERKFGVAPKRSPEVEYQPDIILMEQGDKAIRAIASDGLTWTFDANAPQVSDFAPGKIVFATGRAVGRVASLKRQGDRVQVILGPIQLTDVIRNGRFAMKEEVDLDNMLVYVAPDFPQPPDTTARPPGAATMQPLRNWSVGAAPLSSELTAGLLRTALPMPGVPASQLPSPPADIAPIAPPSKNLPTIDIQNVRVQPIASNSGIGVQYYYNQNGLSVYAGSLVNLTGSGLGFFLDIQNGTIINAGIQLTDASAVKLSLDARSLETFQVNFKKALWVPVGFSIPLGGPVPFAINFDTGFDIGTGFSAKTSKLTAEGNYWFSGGLVAGYLDKKWGVHVPRKVVALLDLGKTVDGVSVGINALVMGADVRATVGIGAFGFTTGVYGNIRAAGTVLRSSDIGFAPRCKQGTIVANVDAGVGYSIPGFAADAINFFLSFVTDYRINRVGSILSLKPPQTLFSGTTQLPGGCASPAPAPDA